MQNQSRPPLTPKRLAIYLFMFIAMIASCVFIASAQKNTLEFTLEDSDISNIQFYYLNDGDSQDDFSEEKSSVMDVSQSKNVLFETTNQMNTVRIDFGPEAQKTVSTEDLKLYSGFLSDTLSAQELKSAIDSGKIISKDISSEIVNLELKITSTGEDPFIIVPLELFDSLSFQTNYLAIAVSVIISAFLTYIIYRYVTLKDAILLFKNLLSSRKTLIKLSVNDFKSRYVGSSFGWIWAFVQPVTTILLFWFVFEIGLRSTGVENVPFILWLMSGLIPWFFFSEAWNGTTGVYGEYSYLVKKVVFKIDILPILKIVSALIIHLFFIVFMLIVFSLYGFFPNVNMLGIIYYMGCMVFLVMGLGLITASISPFFKDLVPIMSIVLQMGMWATPIMWNTSIVGEDLMWIFKMNPMYYVVTGYRSSMLGSVVDAVTIQDTVYFWFISVIILLLGITIFRRLRRHFADVL